MQDHAYQKKNLEEIINGALFAPVFHRHPGLCINQVIDLTPNISYKDVMSYKYIIRGRPLGGHDHYDSEGREIIAEYDTTDDLISAGWRLD